MKIHPSSNLIRYQLQLVAPTYTYAKLRQNILCAKCNSSGAPDFTRKQHAPSSIEIQNSKFKNPSPPTPDSSRSSRTKVPIAPDSSRQSQPETGPIVTDRDLPGAIETKNRFPDEPPSSHPFRLCFCRIQATRVCVFLFAVASWACAPGPGRSLPT